MNSNYHLDIAYIAGFLMEKVVLLIKNIKKRKNLVPTIVGVSVWRFL
jgi:hypothetical protein